MAGEVGEELMSLSICFISFTKKEFNLITKHNY
jgi:hypothetical protein